MAKLYRIKSRYLTKPALITHVDGQVVNLMGVSAKKVIPATDQIPAKTVEIPGATQAQLKAAFEAGNSTIEVVETADDKATKAAV
jgi:hypothetical protein